MTRHLAHRIVSLFLSVALLGTTNVNGQSIESSRSSITPAPILFATQALAAPFTSSHFARHPSLARLLVSLKEFSDYHSLQNYTHGTVLKLFIAAYAEGFPNGRSLRGILDWIAGLQPEILLNQIFAPSAGTRKRETMRSAAHVIAVSESIRSSRRDRQGLWNTVRQARLAAQRQRLIGLASTTRERYTVRTFGAHLFDLASLLEELNEMSLPEKQNALSRVTRVLERTLKADDFDSTGIFRPLFLEVLTLSELLPFMEDRNPDRIKTGPAYKAHMALRTAFFKSNQFSDVERDIMAAVLSRSLEPLDSHSVEKLREGFPIIVKPFGSLDELEQLQRKIGDHEIAYTVLNLQRGKPPIVVLSLEKGAPNDSLNRLKPLATAIGHTHGFESRLTPSPTDRQLAWEDYDLFGLSNTSILSFGTQKEISMTQFIPETSSEGLVRFEHPLSDQSIIDGRLRAIGLIEPKDTEFEETYDGPKNLMRDRSATAIIGDLHGTERLAEILGNDVQNFVQVGDVVGRGLQSEQTLDQLDELQSIAEQHGYRGEVLLGNHEWSIYAGKGSSLAMDTKLLGQPTIDALRKKIKERIVNGRLKVATVVDGAIVTHAGIKGSTWLGILTLVRQTHNLPKDPDMVQVADALNQLVVDHANGKPVNEALLYLIEGSSGILNWNPKPGSIDFAPIRQMMGHVEGDGIRFQDLVGRVINVDLGIHKGELGYLISWAKPNGSDPDLQAVYVGDKQRIEVVVPVEDPVPGAPRFKFVNHSLAAAA